MISVRKISIRLWALFYKIGLTILFLIQLVWWFKFQMLALVKNYFVFHFYFDIYSILFWIIRRKKTVRGTWQGNHFHKYFADKFPAEIHSVFFFGVIKWHHGIMTKKAFNGSLVVLNMLSFCCCAKTPTGLSSIFVELKPQKTTRIINT